MCAQRAANSVEHVLRPDDAGQDRHLLGGEPRPIRRSDRLGLRPSDTKVLQRRQRGRRNLDRTVRDHPNDLA